MNEVKAFCQVSALCPLNPEVLGSLNLKHRKNALCAKSLAFTLVVGLGAGIDRTGGWKWSHTVSAKDRCGHLREAGMVWLSQEKVLSISCARRKATLRPMFLPLELGAGQHSSLLKLCA